MPVRVRPGVFLIYFMSENLLKESMAALREKFPSLKGALFSHFHIGGCQSCAYDDKETLQEVCDRNKLDTTDVLQVVLDSIHYEDSVTLDPSEIVTLIANTPTIYLLDCRTREEHDAIHLKGSKLLTQELQNKLFNECNAETPIILFDHLGTQVIDTCSWFHGHGLKNTRIMRGGIDLWSQEVDSKVPRYKLELS